MACSSASNRPALVPRSAGQPSAHLTSLGNSDARTEGKDAFTARVARPRPRRDDAWPCSLAAPGSRPKRSPRSPRRSSLHPTPRKSRLTWSRRRCSIWCRYPRSTKPN
nr:nitroreductase [uncultured bacterium]